MKHTLKTIMFCLNISKARCHSCTKLSIFVYENLACVTSRHFWMKSNVTKVDARSQFINQELSLKKGITIKCQQKFREWCIFQRLFHTARSFLLHFTMIVMASLISKRKT